MEVGQDMEVGASRATDRWRRAIAATLALWLLMLSTEPGSLNACVLLWTAARRRGAHGARERRRTAAPSAGCALQPPPNAHAGHSATDNDSRAAGGAQCSCLGDC